MSGTKRARRVAICGGIGSGKSVVCRVLRAMGYRVFDTDLEARRIMDTDAGIHRRLNEEIHPQAVVDGRVDRRRISEVVFASAPALAALNGIVHAAVRRELEAWFEAHCGEGDALFVETAILYQSGLDRMVDEVWEVKAPEELRVERVMARNNLSASEVRARIEAQRFEPAERHPHVEVLINDGSHPLLPRIEALLRGLGC
ncbi:MAG: dephospho-CoA kinase [Muribaculaceae bacterium]|nr:dephospho-CoA kinase [Muribaculaceae bacterium]